MCTSSLFTYIVRREGFDFCIHPDPSYTYPSTPISLCCVYSGIKEELGVSNIYDYYAKFKLHVIFDFFHTLQS